MNKKKIFVLLGHPVSDSFSGKLADGYVAAAEKAGHMVKRLNIEELSFDPVLHMGYKQIQNLEPDLVAVQDAFKWADHIVIIYPNWWCSMPAKLKGMFDRMYLPGFAFNFDKATHKLIRRLKGKTARVIVVAGTNSPFMTWLLYGDFTNEISHGILEFAGIKTRVSTFGPSERVSDKVRTRWLMKIQSLGRSGK